MFIPTMLTILKDKYAKSGMDIKYLISPCTDHEIVLLVTLFVPAVGFRLFIFFYMTTDSQAALFRYLYVNWHECKSDAFFRGNWTSILCSELYGQDFQEICRRKTWELWGLFDKVWKKYVVWFLNYVHVL